MAQVDPWWGETAADNQLVTLTGNDNLPDLLIGRLPVSNTTETTTIVNKIIEYELNPPGGPWNTNHIFVADNPDNAGNFHSAADQFYGSLPSSLTGQRFYYGSENNGQTHIYADANELSSSFINALGNGASFVTFYGHSSWEQWAVESLLHLDNLDQLNNQNRLPIISEMTCFTGFFHHPKDVTLDEGLLRQSGGGAVAIWGATGLGVGTGHDQLQKGFYGAIMFDGHTVLGTGVLAGKLNLFSAGYYLDLLDTFTLFGDPALKLSGAFKPDLRITQTINGTNYQPGDQISFIITVENTGAGFAKNIVVVDNLPVGILGPTWSTTAPGVSVDGTYRWDLPDLAPNESVMIVVSGMIDLGLPPDFAITNVVSVTSSGSELSDANNVSVVTVGGSRIYLPIIVNGEGS
jgi:uncharacterized repeat protein (TIGR01451 family)